MLKNKYILVYINTTIKERPNVMVHDFNPCIWEGKADSYLNSRSV